MKKRSPSATEAPQVAFSPRDTGPMVFHCPAVPFSASAVFTQSVESASARPVHKRRLLRQIVGAQRDLLGEVRFAAAQTSSCAASPTGATVHPACARGTSAAARHRFRSSGDFGGRIRDRRQRLHRRAAQLLFWIATLASAFVVGFAQFLYTTSV